MILGFLLTALYIPGIAGAATTPRWALLAVALPIILMFRGGVDSWQHAGLKCSGSTNRNAQIRGWSASCLGWRNSGPLQAGAAPSPRFTLVHFWGCLYLTWVSLSLIWTPNRLDGLNELMKISVLAMAFAFGSRISSLKPLLIGLALGLLLSSCLVMVQLKYPDIVLHTTTHSGLFINSGSLAEIAALVLIGLVYSVSSGGVEGHAAQVADRHESGRSGSAGSSAVCLNQMLDGMTRHQQVGIKPGPLELLLIVGLLPCIILPASRGAWLALITAFTVWLWSKSRLSALALMALAGISLTYSFHLGFHVSSVVQRLGMWSDAIAGLNYLGHGIGSFWTDYAPLSNTLDIFIERPEHLHNDWLELIFEAGSMGAFSIVGVAYCILRGSGGVAALILAGIAAQAFVGFPLHNPCTAFLAALCLGHLARDGADIRDLFHAGRDWFRSWHERDGDRWAATHGPKGECQAISAGAKV